MNFPYSVNTFMASVKKYISRAKFSTPNFVKDEIVISFLPYFTIYNYSIENILALLNIFSERLYKLNTCSFVPFLW